MPNASQGNVVVYQVYAVQSSDLSAPKVTCLPRPLLSLALAQRDLDMAMVCGVTYLPYKLGWDIPSPLHIPYCQTFEQVSPSR